MIGTLKSKSDLFGAFASALCMVHCLLTPFLFIAQACTDTCCHSAPTWWVWIDYIFLIISFFAVRQSAKNSNSPFIVRALWISWVALATILIINGTGLYRIHEYFKYAAALSLIGFHLWNLRFCKCKAEHCCTGSENAV